MLLNIVEKITTSCRQIQAVNEHKYKYFHKSASRGPFVLIQNSQTKSAATGNLHRATAAWNMSEATLAPAEKYLKYAAKLEICGGDKFQLLHR